MPLERDRAAQPGRRRAGAARRPEAQARAVSRAARRRSRRGSRCAAALAGLRGRAATPRRRRSAAPAGDPRPARHARRRLRAPREHAPADRLDDEADDRAAHARARAPRRRRHAGAVLRRRRPSRWSACARGERMTVADLLRALLLASANDAAATLAVDVGGSQARVRAADEPPRARSSGLRDTHYANPIGLDEPGNYSSARDLVKLALRPAPATRSSARRRTGRARRCAAARARARVVNRNDLVARRARSSTASRPATRRSAGYVLVGSATRDGVTVVSVVLGEPERGGARRRHARAAALRPVALPRASPPVRKRRRSLGQRARSKYRDERRRRSSPARTRARRRAPRRARSRVRVAGRARARSTGPLAAGARVGHGRRAPARQGRRRASPLVTARAVAEATLGAARCGDWLGPRVDAASCWSSLAVV